MPVLSIERRDLPSQPLLFVQSRVARHEIPATIAESLGAVFPYAIGAGCAIAGRPLSRYPSMGAGLITIEVGVPIAVAAPGSGRIQAGTLQGGAAAVAIHGGAYDTLSETYAAIERWMETQKVAPGGAPWESYITDPAEHPDPKDWRTEVFWPLRLAGDRLYVHLQTLVFQSQAVKDVESRLGAEIMVVKEIRIARDGIGFNMLVFDVR